MSPEERDRAYLWDMLDAARVIRTYTQQLTYAEFEKDRKLQLAVERLLEIIGEAANRVSQEFQGNHEEIPWRKIIAQRNVLAHEYGDIKLERIWVVVSQSAVSLVSQLELLGLDP